MKFNHLFILVFLLTNVNCNDGFKEVTDKNIEKPSSIYLDNFRRESLNLDGKKKWFITANKAFVYMDGSQQSRLIVYEFEFIEYDENGSMRNTVIANRGDIDYSENILHLDGNVISKNSMGRIVESQKMKYDMEEKIFTSNSRVKIVDRGTLLVCSTGAIIDVQNNKQTCLGPTVIKNNKRNDDNSQEDSLDLDIFQ